MKNKESQVAVEAAAWFVLMICGKAYRCGDDPELRDRVAECLAEALSEMTNKDVVKLIEQLGKVK